MYMYMYMYIYIAMWVCTDQKVTKTNIYMNFYTNAKACMCIPAALSLAHPPNKVVFGKKITTIVVL